MHRYIRLALSAVVPAALLAGCSDWLTASKAINNPNAPTTASRDALLVGVESGTTILQSGDLARLFTTWTQQMAGTDRQAVGLGLYIFDEDLAAGDWSQVYTGGGLVDMRTIRQQALADGDSIYAGVAMVLEALDVGTAADIWGDIPYSQAVDHAKYPTPQLDPQQQVFAEVQAVLDTAIDYLKCDPGTVSTCSGPVTGADLIYGGDPSLWLELAHTLKARFYLHTSPRDPSAYALALAQADSGISDPSHDYRTYQSGNDFPNEANLWYQFMALNRTGYISAGDFLVSLLSGPPADPRLGQYFDKNGSGTYLGAPPGGGSGDYSTLSSTRMNPAFRQPVVTYAENQLIKAEAELQMGQPVAALADYNLERASQGVPPKVGGLTLNEIITEKYIADFQEIEAWNDYKRTCLPALTPAAPPLAAPGGIPGRLLYPVSTERSSNSNIPAPQDQPSRNWDQPIACPGEN